MNVIDFTRGIFVFSKGNVLWSLIFSLLINSFLLVVFSRNFILVDSIPLGIESTKIKMCRLHC